MGDNAHIEVFHSGVDVWNRWREENPTIEPNLTRADFSGMMLSGVNLKGAGLFKTKFNNCDLSNANLRQARIVQTDFSGSNLTGAHIYGISAWDMITDNAIQSDLIITKPSDALITVDDINVAQFIYLMLNNSNIRNVIDAISSKGVLILGRFSKERKPVLDAIKSELRTRGYLPILFDFDGPTSRNTTETVRTLALLSKFVIGDLTDPKSIPYELQAIAPTTRVPVLTVIEKGQAPFSMFSDLPAAHFWVSGNVMEYEDENHVRQMVDTLLQEGDRIRDLIYPQP